MADTDNVANLRNWFRQCPAVLKRNRFRADYLAEAATEYSIFTSPSTLRSHENILGEVVLDDIQTQNFIFASKVPYGPDVEQNLANLVFYQDVMRWMIEQNNSGNFPEWEGGTVRAILPTITAYPAQAGSDTAKYQIQVQITYRRNST